MEFYPYANVPDRAMHEYDSCKLFVMTRTGEKNSSGEDLLERRFVGRFCEGRNFMPDYNARCLCADTWLSCYGEYGFYGPEKASGPLMFMIGHELFADLHQDLVKAFGVSRALAMENMALRVMGDIHGSRDLPRSGEAVLAPHVVLMSAIATQLSLAVDKLCVPDVAGLHKLSSSWTRKIYDWACTHARDDDTGVVMEADDPDSVWITVRLVLSRDSTIDYSRRNAMPEHVMQRPTHIVEAVHAGTGTVICVMGDNRQPAKSKTLHRMVEHLNGLGIRIKGAVLLNGIIAGWVDNFNSLGLKWVGLGEKHSPSWQAMMNQAMETLADSKKCPEYSPSGAIWPVGQNVLPGGKITVTLHTFYDGDAAKKSYALQKRRNSMMERCSFVTEHDLEHDIESCGVIVTSLDTSSPQALRNSLKKAGIDAENLNELLEKADSKDSPVDPAMNFELVIGHKGEDPEFLKEAAHVGRRVRFDEDAVIDLAGAIHGQSSDNETGHSLTQLFSHEELMSLMMVNQLVNVFFSRTFRTASLAWNYERIAALMGVRIVDDKQSHKMMLRMCSFAPVDQWPSYLGFTRDEAGALVARCNSMRACLDIFVMKFPITSLKCADEIDSIWSELLCHPLNVPDNRILTDAFVERMLVLFNEKGADAVDITVPAVDPADVDRVVDLHSDKQLLSLPHYQYLVRSMYAIMNRPDAMTQEVLPAELDLSRSGYSSMVVDMAPDSDGDDKPGQESLDASTLALIRGTCAISSGDKWVCDSEIDYERYLGDNPPWRDADDDDESWDDDDDDESWDDEDDELHNELKNKLFGPDHGLQKTASDIQDITDVYRILRRSESLGELSGREYDKQVAALNAVRRIRMERLKEDNKFIRNEMDMPFQENTRRYGDKGDKLPYLCDVAVPDSAWVNKKTGIVYDRRADSQPVQSNQRLPRHLRRAGGGKSAQAVPQADVNSSRQQDGGNTKPVAIGRLTTEGMMRPYPELKTAMPEVWRSVWGPEGPDWRFEDQYNVGLYMQAMTSPAIRFGFLSHAFYEREGVNSLRCCLKDTGTACCIFDVALDMYARGMAGSSPQTVSAMQQQGMSFSMFPSAPDEIISKLGSDSYYNRMYSVDTAQPVILNYGQKTAHFRDLDEPCVWITVNQINVSAAAASDGVARNYWCVMAFMGEFGIPVNYAVFDDSYTLLQATTHLLLRIKIYDVTVKGIILGSGIVYDNSFIDGFKKIGLRMVQLCSVDDELHAQLCSKLAKKSWKLSVEAGGDMGAASCILEQNFNGVTWSRAALAVSEFQVSRDLPHLYEMSSAAALKGSGQDNVFEGRDLNSFEDRVALFGETFLFTGRPDRNDMQEIGRCAAAAADMLGCTVTFAQGYQRHKVPDALRGELSSFNPDNSARVASAVLTAAFWSRVIALRDYLSTFDFPGGQIIHALEKINLNVIRDSQGKVRAFEPVGTPEEQYEHYGYIFSWVSEDLNNVSGVLREFFENMTTACVKRPYKDFNHTEALSWLIFNLGLVPYDNLVIYSCDLLTGRNNYLQHKAYIEEEDLSALYSKDM